MSQRCCDELIIKAEDNVNVGEALITNALNLATVIRGAEDEQHSAKTCKMITVIWTNICFLL